MEDVAQRPPARGTHTHSDVASVTGARSSSPSRGHRMKHLLEPFLKRPDTSSHGLTFGLCEAADRYFADLNSFLKAEGSSRRYQFHFLSPEDYDKFSEAMREGKLESFRSKLHADLVA